MFLTEPIVLTLSLLRSFSDALIFMFIQSFTLVYKQWNFSILAVGLSFIPIGVGYAIAWALFIPAIRRNRKERRAKPDDERAQYESLHSSMPTDWSYWICLDQLGTTHPLDWIDGLRRHHRHCKL